MAITIAHQFHPCPKFNWLVRGCDWLKQWPDYDPLETWPAASLLKGISGTVFLRYGVYFAEHGPWSFSSASASFGISALAPSAPIHLDCNGPINWGYPADEIVIHQWVETDWQGDTIDRTARINFINYFGSGGFRFCTATITADLPYSEITIQSALDEVSTERNNGRFKFWLGEQLNNEGYSGDGWQAYFSSITCHWFDPQ